MNAPQAYEHSWAFDRLKDVTETLPSNLTSPEYIEILDRLLLGAVRPIVLETNVFDAYLARVIAWQEAHRKRKVSFVPRAEFLPIALAWMALDTREAKAELLPNLKLDRALLTDFSSAFHKSMVRYEDACLGRLHLNGRLASTPEQLAFIQETHHQIGANHLVLSMLRDSRNNLSGYEAFKQVILEKYYRKCLTAAQRDYVSVFRRSIRLSDLVQGYQEAAVRALDKCDPLQGVLTNLIDFWLLSARALFTKERTSNEQNVPLPDTEAELEPLVRTLLQDDPGAAAEQELQNERIRGLARIVDPEGSARLYLGLQESSSWLEDQAC